MSTETFSNSGCDNFSPSGREIRGLADEVAIEMERREVFGEGSWRARHFERSNCKATTRRNASLMTGKEDDDEALLKLAMIFWVEPVKPRHGKALIMQELGVQCKHNDLSLNLQVMLTRAHAQHLHIHGSIQIMEWFHSRAGPQGRGRARHKCLH